MHFHTSVVYSARASLSIHATLSFSLSHSYCTRHISYTLHSKVKAVEELFVILEYEKRNLCDTKYNLFTKHFDNPLVKRQIPSSRRTPDSDCANPLF